MTDRSPLGGGFNRRRGMTRLIDALPLPVGGPGRLRLYSTLLQHAGRLRGDGTAGRRNTGAGGPRRPGGMTIFAGPQLMDDRSHFDAVYRWGAESAEVEYLRARAHGMTEPVVELRAADPADPSRVDIIVVERQDLVARLRGRYDAAAAVIADGPQPGHFLLLVTVPGAAHVLHRPIPRP